MPEFTPIQIAALLLLLAGIPGLYSFVRSLLGSNREWRRLLLYDALPFAGLGVALFMFGSAAEGHLKSRTMLLVFTLLLMCYGLLALVRTDWMTNPFSSGHDAERDRVWWKAKGVFLLIVGTLALIFLYCIGD